MWYRSLIVLLALVCTGGIAAGQSKAGDVRHPPASEAGLGPMKPGSSPGCSLERVVDFRTLVLRVDAGVRTVRLIGLESAAVDPDRRHEAQVQVENLIKGESLTVVVPQDVGVDKDASPLVVVRREPEGLDIGLELLRQGYARLDARFDDVAKALPPAQAEQYRKAADRAKELKKGLWAPAPKPVAEKPTTEKPATEKPATQEKSSDATKKGQPASGEIVFVTPSGKKYHRENCKFLSKNAKPMSLEEARKKYEPCSTCDPPK